MTSWAFTGYLFRHLKQFRYIRHRKIHNEKVRRHKKSFFIPIGLHSVTISDVINYNQYKQFPKKKRGKGERQNEKKEKEKKEVEKRRRRKRDGKSLYGRKGKGGE